MPGICLTASAALAGPPDRVEQLEFDPAENTWVELVAPEPGTPEGDLALARRALADGEPSAALKACRNWTRAYGGHALFREVRLIEARALVDEREHYKGHLICDSLMAELATDEISRGAAELDFLIAEIFLSGVRRKWWGMRIKPAEDLGIQILDRIGLDFAHTELGEYALMTKADYYFNHGEFFLAEDEYGRLLDEYPASHYAQRAALRRAQAALGRFPGTPFDDAALVEAEERYLAFASAYPDASEGQDVGFVLDDIRNKRAQKELEIAAFYVKIGQSQAAAFYCRSVIQNWPGTVAATQAESKLVALEGTPAE